MARSGRILVVDDEVSARTALAELLRDKELDVETAADAVKALGKCESFAPHVVITDLKMPGMGGIELVAKLRAQADPPAVIVMTAFGAVTTAVEAMRAGATEYLTKPINFDELLGVVDKALEPRQLPANDGPTELTSRMPPIPGSTLAELERYAILESLKATGGSTSKAAEMLGISVRTIQYRLHEYGAASRSAVTVVHREAAESRKL